MLTVPVVPVVLIFIISPDECDQPNRSDRPELRKGRFTIVSLA